MQIQSLDNTNFKGGFRFPQMPLTPKKELKNFVRRGKQIFYNFEKDGDVFLVTRDELDRKVADFILKHSLKFVYYPKINTHAGLDCEIPETLSNIVNKYTGYTGNIRTLIKYANADRKKELLSNKPKSYIDNILMALKLELNNPKKSRKSGVVKLTDVSAGKTVTISPPSLNNVHYVAVDSEMSTSSMDMSQRYAIKDDGTILKVFKTIDEFIDFRNRFNSTLSKEL